MKKEENPMLKKAETSVEINPIIANRWSPRSFDKNKNLTQEQITQLLEAARWAPSSMNEQPWRFLVANRNENSTIFWQMFECLAEGNQVWCKNVNTLILVTAYQKYSNGDFNASAQFDTGLAAENLILQAVSMGLAAHPMGGFDKSKLKEILQLSDDYTLLAIIAVGYQDEAEKLEDILLIRREKAPRTRKQIKDLLLKN